jgi:hypothetical protein
MSSFGVTLEGFNPKTLEIVLQELEDADQAAFGAAINTTPESVLGQLNSIVGDKITELWEVANAVNAASARDQAQGTALDNVGAITGATRLAATKSTVTLRANLTAGTILNVGRVVSVSTTGARFVTTEAVSNTTGATANIAVEAESEEFGPVIGSSGTIDTIESPVAGWTAQAALDSTLTEPFALSNGQTLTIAVDAGAPQLVTFVTGDFVDIANATATEIATVIDANTTGITSQNANSAVRITSDTDGPGSSIQVTGGSANPQIGFSTDLVDGMNDLDAIVGRDIETDANFRVRQEELLRISGAATVEAIRSDLIEVDNVTQAFVFENVTLVTDINGLPGKSFEAVVSGGTDQDIAQAIFDSRAAGIETFRDPGVNGVTVFIEDSQEILHETNFSRPTPIVMTTLLTITTDSAVFGGGDEDAGKQQVKEAIALLGQQQGIGQDVVVLRFQCEPLSVAGVTDVTFIEISPPATTSGTIVIDVRELATFDTSDVTVTVDNP